MSVKKVAKSSAVIEVVGGGGGVIYDKRTRLDIGHRYTNLLQDTLYTNPTWPLEILQNTEENNGHLNNRRGSRRTSDNQGLEGAVRAGLEERGQMSSRQEVKVEHKLSVAAFTSRDEKWVGEGREEDTTEERWEGERERRFRLKVTGTNMYIQHN